MSNVQSQGSSCSGDLASDSHTRGGGERHWRACAERCLILGRVADQGWMGPTLCPRKAVVTGQEGHRPLQGAGTLRGQGPGAEQGGGTCQPASWP